MNNKYDVIIVGAGAVGLVAALSLRQLKLNVLILDAKPETQTSNNNISLVLNKVSINILQNLGLYQHLDTTSIMHCVVSAAKHIGKVRMLAADVNVDRLASVTSLGALSDAALDILKGEKNIKFIYNASVVAIAEHGSKITYAVAGNNYSATTKLLLAADSANSACRNLSNISVIKEDLAYSSLVLHVKTSLPHKQTAQQKFLLPGSLAFIPQKEYEGTLIWTLPTKLAELRAKKSVTELLHLATKEMSATLGTLTSTTSVIIYPVRLQKAQTCAADSLVLLGPAANNLMPITAQGLNLAIRDIAAVTDIISHVNYQGWDSSLAKNYIYLRQQDHNNCYRQVKYLQKIFTDNSSSATFLRSLVLSFTGSSPYLVSKLANLGIGRSGYNAKLSLGLPFEM